MNIAERILCQVAKLVTGTYEGPPGTVEFELRPTGPDRLQLTIISCYPSSRLISEERMTWPEAELYLKHTVVAELAACIGYHVT